MTGTMGENASTPRPKRLHWTSVLVLLFMASFFGVWQVRGTVERMGEMAIDFPSGTPAPNQSFITWRHGWPATFLMRDVHSRSFVNPTEADSWKLSTGFTTITWSALVFDIALCLVLACSTVIGVELLVRSRRLQFGIRSLLALTAVAAIVAWLTAERLIGWKYLLYLPVAFSILCLIGVIIWSVIRIAGRNFRTQAALGSLKSPPEPLNKALHDRHDG